ncbi:MAG: RIP metalloprotease RseP [Gammaproteobacteria bacterium]|nr:RIP metalloprotease RseP [Gammaproteobacteria bacterium]
MTYLIAFVVAILILVFFHELGHFLVARWAGVRVLTFSIGFGPKLWSFKDRRGTEYQLAAIPIGGYVRMLGEDEFSEQPQPDEVTEAFSNAKPSRKVAIAAAGPFASLLLGLVIIYVVLITGTHELEPYVGEVTPGSPAMLAGIGNGEEILRVDGREVNSWQDVSLALAERLGDTGTIQVQTDRGEYNVRIDAWLSEEVDPDVVTEIGLEPQLRAHVSFVADDSAALQAGLRVGDYISRIDNRSVDSWQDVVDVIRSSAERQLLLTVERDGEVVSLVLVPRTVIADDGSSIGQAGIRPQVGRVVRYGPIAAIPLAFEKTLDYVALTAESIYKMIVGDVHAGNLGGPVRIAEFAGDLAELGVTPYLMLLALLTIALGLINLLPIPMLDGGHVLFGLVEWLTNKPIPLRVQAIGMRIGLFVVGSIMIFALYNDIARLVAS